MIRKKNIGIPKTGIDRNNGKLMQLKTPYTPVNIVVTKMMGIMLPLIPLPNTCIPTTKQTAMATAIKTVIKSMVERVMGETA